MASLRPIAFVLSSSNHGSMLVNRFDYRIVANSGYGVGFQILNNSCFDADEVNIALALLQSRKQHFGDGVVAIDCGANIGVHTIEWAKTMHGWGSVIAFEAQERVFYALAGNITLNNCFNAKAIYAAVGATDGEISVPVPDYFTPSSFGSLEIRQKPSTEFIGQEIRYDEEHCLKTKMMAIDSLELKRLDFIKIDIEGMEVEALTGAEKSIGKFKPILLIEKIKSDETAIQDFLAKHDYKVFQAGINLLAVHQDDPTLANINIQQAPK
jgi:FkbM family methyltransferase